MRLSRWFAALKCKRPFGDWHLVGSPSPKSSSRKISCTVLRARREMMDAQTLSLRGPDMVGSSCPPSPCFVEGRPRHE